MLDIILEWHGAIDSLFTCRINSASWFKIMTSIYHELYVVASRIVLTRNLMNMFFLLRYLFVSLLIMAKNKTCGYVSETAVRSEGKGDLFENIFASDSPPPVTPTRKKA